MPENDSNTKKIVIALTLLAFITFALGGFALYKYISTKKSANLGNPFGSNQNNQSQELSPAQVIEVDPTDSYSQEGYLQEISNIISNINGVEYTYVVGLLGLGDESIPLWITQQEYENIKVLDYTNGGVETSLDSLKGGMKIKFIRTLNPDDTSNPSQITLEII